MGSLTHLESLQFLKTSISFNISPKELKHKYSTCTKFYKLFKGLFGVNVYLRRCVLYRQARQLSLIE